MFLGIVSGVIIGGFGFGAFVFNFVMKAIINPNNEKAVNGKFHPDVAKNVPFCLKIVSGCYLIIGILGTLLLKEIKPI